MLVFFFQNPCFALEKRRRGVHLKPWVSQSVCGVVLPDEHMQVDVIERSRVLPKYSQTQISRQTVCVLSNLDGGMMH